MLLTVSALPRDSPFVRYLACSQAFIESVGTYISHLDPSVRRCGMLVAEVVANVVGKSLDFSQWSGEGQGQEWARAMRELIVKRDVDVQEVDSDVLRLEIEEDEIDAAKQTSSEVRPKPHRAILVDKEYDSDDSLEGYDSEDSDAPSPTPSELDEIEKDPTMNVGKKKITRPVYLIDLANLITSSTKPDDPQNADRIEMALNCAEELIRKKRGFGFELGECFLETRGQMD